MPGGSVTAILGDGTHQITASVTDSGGKDSEPLLEISRHRYLERVGQGVSTTPGTRPVEFNRFDSVLYLWPAPASAEYPSMKVSPNTSTG